LMFTKDAAIIDPTELREVYHLLISILQKVAPLPTSAPTSPSLS
jgi:hypothetical protein